MNSELKKAIESYCAMLPYPNTGSNPNDDTRLYTISYFLVKTGEPFDTNFFKSELRKNDRAQLNIMNDKAIEKFVENRKSEIENGHYVLSRISELIF